MDKLSRGIRVVCAFFGTVMRIMLAVMFAIFISLVVTRYFFSYSPPWSEEIARFLLIWISMLGAAVLIVYQDHFALHMLVERLSPKAKLYHSFLIQVLVLVVCVFVFIESIDFAISSMDVIAPGSQVSIFYSKAAIPVGLALMVIFSVISLFDIGRRIRGAKGSFLPPQSIFMDSTFKPSETTASDDLGSSVAGYKK